MLFFTSWVFGVFLFVFLSFFFFFFFVFLWPHPWHMEVPRLGSNWSCGCQPTPEPQQLRIWDASATHTTAHGNAGPLTNWARPRIEPMSSWILVGFVTAEPWWKLLLFPLFSNIIHWEHYTLVFLDTFLIYWSFSSQELVFSITVAVASA